jgi:hypothetical protein
MVPRGAALVAEHHSALQNAYLDERSTHSADEALSRALARTFRSDDCATVSAFIAGDLDAQLRAVLPAGERFTSGRELGELLRRQLEELHLKNGSVQRQADHWRHLNTTGLALDFTHNSLLLDEFDRALQSGDETEQRRVVSQAVDALVEKAQAETRTRKRRRVALQCAAGFFKAQATEIAGGEDFAVAMARLQATERYQDALCMLWCQSMMVALAREIAQLA